MSINGIPLPPCGCDECAAAAPEAGYVEIPAGSGIWFATDGTLATHPQGELLRARVKDFSGRVLVDDMPIVIDHFAPRGMAYVLGDMIFVNRAGEKIEQAWTMDLEAARRILEQRWTKANYQAACEWAARLPGMAELQEKLAKGLTEATKQRFPSIAGPGAEAEHTTERRRVALTDLPSGDHISTVLLHSHLADGSDPDAYETLVTRGPHEGLCERHATRREAERAHRVMVDMLSADE